MIYNCKIKYVIISLQSVRVGPSIKVWLCLKWINSPFYVCIFGKLSNNFPLTICSKIIVNIYVNEQAVRYYFMSVVLSLDSYLPTTNMQQNCCILLVYYSHTSIIFITWQSRFKYLRFSVQFTEIILMFWYYI